MKILVANTLDHHYVQSGLGPPVVYRPELADSPLEQLAGALSEHQPDAMLVNGRSPAASAPAASVLASWAEKTRCRPFLVQCVDPDHHQGSEAGELGREQLAELGVEVDHFRGRLGQGSTDLAALGRAERRTMEQVTAQRLAGLGESGGLGGASVSLVGAGIVNLMIALDLVRQGARVEIVDAGPDPLSSPDWRLLGATHGGGDARMFCFTEADNYNEKGHRVYADMDQIFRRTIEQGGWLAVEPERLGPSEMAWIQRFHALPPWRAEVFTQDIHSFSVASHPLWQRLRQTETELFENVGLTQGVLRLYRQKQKVETAEALHTRLGSLIRALDPQELVAHHPACRDAVEQGHIAGALEVHGFTLNIHTFVRRLLGRLKASGVGFRWQTRMETIERSDGGEVVGLRAADGGLLRSDHYVISPGVYGESLLRGTRSVGKIQGILGLWMALPNLDPALGRSVKIHREGHVGEDSNVTLGRDAEGRPILLLGSGYGFLGHQSLDMESPQIDSLYEALEETGRRYFPRSYAAAEAAGTLYSLRKACVRPFTCTGLGTFEVLGTADGGRLVVASGHNTGGFAQAPAVAEAVGQTLCGRPHPMQSLYDPERGIVPDALLD